VVDISTVETALRLDLALNILWDTYFPVWDGQTPSKRSAKGS